jgi:hypothetical protein
MSVGGLGEGSDAAGFTHAGPGKLFAGCIAPIVIGTILWSREIPNKEEL